MNIIELLQKELEIESGTTRKMLERVPEEQWDWKPHEKNMNMMQLTTHVAELPTWISMGLRTDGFDFAAHPYQPKVVHSRQELLQLFEASLLEGTDVLSKATEADLTPTWTLRSGDQIFMTMTKYEVIRHALAQTIHHRAQLGVYLRLLNIPIPGSYGPSADEQGF